jgi:hypothetical protein
MPFRIGARLTAFLAEPLPLVVGTMFPGNGGVHMLPTWYEFRESLFWVNALFLAGRGPTELWIRNLERNPNATLFIHDDRALRWVRIEARLLDSIKGPDDHMARLSQRYAGGPKPDPGIDPQTYRFDPGRVTGGNDSTQSWDV